MHLKDSSERQISRVLPTVVSKKDEIKIRGRLLLEKRKGLRGKGVKER